MLKKLFVVALLFCSTLAFAQNSNLKIFFVNGIANSEIDARNAARSLSDVLSSLTGNLAVESIYNPTGRNSGTSISGQCDTYDPNSTGLVVPPESLSGLVPPTLPLNTRLSRATPCIISDLGELRDSKLNEENYSSAYARSFIVGNNLQSYANLSRAVASQFKATYFSNEKPVVQKVA